MKIFLLGLPGSGKSTLGKELASSLKIPFIDLDHEVERLEGRPIAEIFKEMTEDYFRKIESAELKKWCASNQDFVMATGGGAPCFFDNMATINRSGKSFFLDVPPAEIAERISKTSLHERPLLASAGQEGLKDHLESMRSSRIYFYSQARHVFTGDRIEASQILHALKN